MAPSDHSIQTAVHLQAYLSVVVIFAVVVSRLQRGGVVRASIIIEC